ncbi:MAG TPA: phosphoadenosine phosphosulfate reductase family protein, partial [Microbacterium sp.]|nr:phosphoadenosine phosphosulfate reductase family protein [Microbacterium sp.]
NGRVHPGESIRVFPISNWTELDIWRYIEADGVEIPGIYFARERETFVRDGMVFEANRFSSPKPGEEVSTRTVRYRTVGDATLTAAVESTADTLEKIIDEIASTRITERGATRGDDRVSDSAMEDRKKQGYF